MSVLLLFSPSAAAWGSLTVLVGATAGLERARRLDVGCACFGRLTPASRPAFVRNGILIALAAGAVILATSWPATDTRIGLAAVAAAITAVVSLAQVDAAASGTA